MIDAGFQAMKGVFDLNGEERFWQSSGFSSGGCYEHRQSNLGHGILHRYRGLEMLESGEVKSLREPSSRKDLDNSYVSRMVNLSMRAPDIAAEQLAAGLHTY